MTNYCLKYKTLIFLLIILAIATFFRFWQLSSIPPGLYPDVAIYGNDAIASLKTGEFKIFYPENNGREGLFMWLLALSFSIFGISYWSIKIVTAVIGILTVLGLYLLTKELFSQIVKQSDSQFIALLSSFFLAISFWHTNFSRIGFRAILLPFVLVFAFYFLFKGFRTQRFLNFIVSGIFFGLGFYTYISYRFIVLLLPVVLLCWWFVYRKQKLHPVRNTISNGVQKKYLFSIFYFLFSIFIVALPIGLYFLQHPQDFIGRAAPISIFSAENPIKEFGKSLALHLGMFNFYGDSNWRHNFSGSPMLFWPIGILFLIGIILSFRETFRKSNYQNKNYQSLSTFYFLLSTFFIMLLPGILTYEGIPHALRTIGVIPVVYIFAGLGGWKIYNFIEKNTKSPEGPRPFSEKGGTYGVKKRLLLVASLFFLFAVSFSGFHKYFFDWGKNKEVERAFTKQFADIGYFLNSLPDDAQKYVIVNESGVPVPFPDGLPMPAQTIMFIENMKYGSLQSIYLLPKDLNKIEIDQPTIIVPMKYDEDLFEELYQKFSHGETQEKDGIWIYEIKSKIKYQNAK